MATTAGMQIVRNGIFVSGERQKKERGEVRHGLLSRYTRTVR